MTTEPEVNIEALDAGYKVELRQYDAEIVYVYITPQLIESKAYETAAEAWQAAYEHLEAVA